MKVEEFEENQKERWKLLEKKEKYYGEAWRKYCIKTLLELAFDRLKEVKMVYEDMKAIDRDNLMDVMNFCDMILRKIK